MRTQFFHVPQGSPLIETAQALVGSEMYLNAFSPQAIQDMYFGPHVSHYVLVSRELGLLAAAGLQNVGEPVCILDYLVVPPDKQNRGHGSRALRKLEAEAHLLGSAEMSLDPLEAAKPFYLHRGYAPIAVRDFRKPLGEL